MQSEAPALVSLGWEPPAGCMVRDVSPTGERCINPRDSVSDPLCVPMECSADGEVLVLGEPCDPGAPPPVIGVSLELFHLDAEN